MSSWYWPIKNEIVDTSCHRNELAVRAHRQGQGEERGYHGGGGNTEEILCLAGEVFQALGGEHGADQEHGGGIDTSHLA